MKSRIEAVGSKVLPVMACLFVVGMTACSPDLLERKEVSSSYESAKSALLKEAYIDVDVIWLVNEISRIDPDENLRNLAVERKSRLVGHPYLSLIDRNAPRIPLPASPGKGMDRFFVYMMAPFGEPKNRAIAYIEDYLSAEASGYILTHQFLSLVWAEQVGLSLPQALLNRKDDLLNQIYQEQLASGENETSMDLYAERVALLLRYSKPPENEAERWVYKLIEAQLPGGAWPGSNPVLFYDGQYGSSVPAPAHTIVLSMLALQSYMQRY